MSAIVQELTIKATPENVFQAIAEADGVTRWWANDVVAEQKVGSITEIRFDNGEVMKMEVAELEVGKKVHWLVRQAPQTYWRGTKITWDLMPDSKGTKLLFGHHGFAESDADYGYEQTCMGWEYFLSSLKSYLETGRGTPYIYHGRR